MASHNMTDPVSEAAEMYLLRIALLSQDDNLVPISRLAEMLDVSPISANQMCRKLEIRGLVDYQPYKGAALTEQGQKIALRVLRKRRLWEVFLSERLGIAPEMAEDMACRFEHVTPEPLAEKLADFLGNPALSPQQQPIPPRLDDASRRDSRPLTSLGVGQRACIAKILADDALIAFLQMQHIGPGAELKVLAIAQNQAVLLNVAEQHVALDFEIAQKIKITPLLDAQPKVDCYPLPLSS